jgi:hypothetical protein
MDFNSFLRYLKVKRWSRVFAFFFGALCLTIIAVRFWKFQTDHIQMEWNFKNVGSFWNERIDLEAGVTYKVSWKNKQSVPYLMTINEYEVATPNIKYTCRNCYYYYTYVINEQLTSPFYLKLDRETTIGLHFKKVNPPDHSKPFFEFMKWWLKSWFDVVAIHEWSVERVDDTHKYYLLFDKSIKIIKNQNVR